MTRLGGYENQAPWTFLMCHRYPTTTRYANDARAGRVIRQGGGGSPHGRREADLRPRPVFGLCVLAENASRALSPAVNDPGTAIDVIGRGVRLLAQRARFDPRRSKQR